MSVVYPGEFVLGCASRRLTRRKRAIARVVNGQWVPFTRHPDVAGERPPAGRTPRPPKDGRAGLFVSSRCWKWLIVRIRRLNVYEKCLICRVNAY